MNNDFEVYVEGYFQGNKILSVKFGKTHKGSIGISIEDFIEILRSLQFEGKVKISNRTIDEIENFLSVNSPVDLIGMKFPITH